MGILALDLTRAGAHRESARLPHTNLIMPRSPSLLVRPPLYRRARPEGKYSRLNYTLLITETNERMESWMAE